ncbi:VWA domain-containing protein [Glaciecola sp. SC05]|uniref:vWA domain-containing protein n=1 Tax=Glaciecola sp. SC05 TaxID=1987355 RepID=UPI0035270B7B
MFDNFHFLRPSVLLLIPAMIVLVWVWMRIKLASSQWQSILPAHLHQRLVTVKGDRQSKQAFIWLMIAMSIACLGIAGPAWEKLPQPVYQTDSGRVVVMDMSLSMRATDISPSRLARAKFKAIDLIKEINDGEVGLVAYAADAFIISPLTEDISNLENLIPSLSPEIMPSSGSNPKAGFELAKQLLDNAGYKNGHIYWITDGIELDDVAPLRELINSTQYEFSALTIGTDQGAPIQLLDGSLLKDNSGAIVIPRMNRAYLEQALAPSNARFTQISIDDSDIRSMLLTSSRLDQIREGKEEQSTGDAWRDMGAYLAILLLPIALLMFRKGVLFSALLITLIPMQSAEVFAQDTTPAQPNTNQAEQTLTGNIQSLFLNRNQRGLQAFKANDFEAAAKLFDDINWQAAAAYKAGDFETAANLYQQADGLDSIYNRGNALAKMGELQDALDAYEKVLKLSPEHQQAARNKKIVEDLIDQQQNQPEQEQQQDQPSESEQENEQNGEGEQQEQSQDGSQNDQNSEQNSQEADQNEQQKQSEDQNQQGEGQQDQSEQSSSEAQQNDQQENDQQQQASSDAQQQNTEAETEQEQEQDMQSVQAVDQSELTPEEREQMQRLQTLMNKVPDDPAFLLQRKMLIESQRRKQYAPPTTQEQEW